MTVVLDKDDCLWCVEHTHTCTLAGSKTCTHTLWLCIMCSLSCSIIPTLFFFIFGFIVCCFCLQLLYKREAKEQGFTTMHVLALHYSFPCVTIMSIIWTSWSEPDVVQLQAYRNAYYKIAVVKQATILIFRPHKQIISEMCCCQLFCPMFSYK